MIILLAKSLTTLALGSSKTKDKFESRAYKAGTKCKSLLFGELDAALESAGESSFTTATGQYLSLDDQLFGKRVHLKQKAAYFKSGTKERNKEEETKMITQCLSSLSSLIGRGGHEETLSVESVVQQNLFALVLLQADVTLGRKNL